MKTGSALKRSITLILICSMFMCGITACARKPSEKSTEHIIKKYFHKYGNKYKDTDFGKHDVDYVKVMDIEEMHKHMVTAKAQVQLKDGPSFFVRCMIDKRTFGWRVESWENMQ